MPSRDLKTLLRRLEVSDAHELEVRVVRNTAEAGTDPEAEFEAWARRGSRLSVGRLEYGLLLTAGAQYAPQAGPPDPNALAPAFNCAECGEPMHRPQKVEIAPAPNARGSEASSTVTFYCAKCHAELFGDLERD